MSRSYRSWSITGDVGFIPTHNYYYDPEKLLKDLPYTRKHEAYEAKFLSSQTDNRSAFLTSRHFATPQSLLLIDHRSMDKNGNLYNLMGPAGCQFDFVEGKMVNSSYLRSIKEKEEPATEEEEEEEETLTTLSKMTYKDVLERFEGSDLAVALSYLRANRQAKTRELAMGTPLEKALANSSVPKRPEPPALTEEVPEEPEVSAAPEVQEKPEVKEKAEVQEESKE